MDKEKECAASPGEFECSRWSSIEGDIDSLRQEQQRVRDVLEAIQQRNELKEADKMFEGSYVRMLTIMIITYCALFGYMLFLGVKQPALNAVVPTTGFCLSTWSLSCKC